MLGPRGRGTARLGKHVVAAVKRLVEHVVATRKEEVRRPRGEIRLVDHVAV